MIDLNVFEQVGRYIELATNHVAVTNASKILEMDDDPDDRDFSKEIVVGFFEQAEGTLEKMNTSL